ncbi:hypothetical protein SAMN06273572_102575 [Monaibacterium marinum]|uniref:Uncharacterized protein n=1 Tax=Pontivivens marinum TaxID=1690039 RepID=A0A2C9CRB1_9RHOB|nr:hypothetical protein SAMN06273572_102575 [Monaibacterium marinum]
MGVIAMRSLGQNLPTAYGAFKEELSRITGAIC